MEDLIGRTGLRRDSVYKLICLPPISRRGGCALLQPAPAPSPASSTLDDNGSDDDDDDDDEESIDDNSSGSGGASNNVVRSILGALGGYVECRDDDVMEAMMVTTCMMGPMYGVMRTNRDWLGELFLSGPLRGRPWCALIAPPPPPMSRRTAWGPETGEFIPSCALQDRSTSMLPQILTRAPLSIGSPFVLKSTNERCRIRNISRAVNRGVSPADASYFVGRSYLSMVQDAEVDCDVNPRRFDDLIEEQTPGGLNEQVRIFLRGFSPFEGEETR